ncbi:adenylate kinase [Gelria sp. Kuro-4]|uniref:adenylate kinase n=1 Tax=Gelria sp. Kuro-4 TaxID=2796927 RepID=UPI001BEDB84A|nr:adenylate kinase [Gelria sp. Kuro-4]BCV24298.1 adenylate kinase [Gelria sp. Kuro-4]
MQLVLLGAPGAGKGTQGELLAQEYGIPHIATGDLLRGAMAAETPLGEAARRYVARGELVPDEVVVGIVRERLTAPDAEAGFILDGFPRTEAQAEDLDAFLEELGRPLTAAVLLDVARETLLARLTARRVCPQCGASFHLVNRPPKEAGRCDACGAPLVQREDDRTDVIARRLEVYQKETAPLVEFYARRGLLVRVPGTGTPAEILARVKAALGEGAA